MSVIVGDCVEVMAAMPSASVDVIVTDPPYGLEFMGKEWDRLGRAMQEWHERWAREALRVLKPGGYLLAFGGTRTYHRLACAVEDAGFEIRDRILVESAEGVIAEPHPVELAWMYGSGFPKSLDVSKAIDKAAGIGTNAERARRFQVWAQTTGVTTRQIDEATGTKMGSHFLNHPTQPRLPTLELFELMRPLFEHVPDEIEALVGSRQVERENLARRPVVEEGALGAGNGSVIGLGSESSMLAEFDRTAAWSEEARPWQGWGTALKPAHEPIVVARKPLAERNVAANVLAHGTGGINVDGCRVGSFKSETPSGMDRFNRANAAQGYRPGAYQKGEPPLPMTEGRWPANVVLVHADECKLVGTKRVPTGTTFEQPEGTTEGRGMYGPKSLGRVTGYAADDGMETMEAWECVGPDEDGNGGCPVRALDEQSGKQKDGTYVGRNRVGQKPANVYGEYAVDTEGVSYGGAGGASRFFYTAKASRSEREAGLLGKVPCARCGGLDTTEHGGDGPTDTVQRGTCIRNDHPTVKPIDLMRWLVRLVTPPGGRVLDPFTGSGTTGIAAALEGVEFFGVEKDERSALIAGTRIEWFAEHGPITEEVSAATIVQERASRSARGELTIPLFSQSGDA